MVDSTAIGFILTMHNILWNAMNFFETHNIRYSFGATATDATVTAALATVTATVAAAVTLADNLKIIGVSVCLYKFICN